jgi:phospholipid/cholesterol/gamma-HCH transport system permease protein
MSWLNPSDVGFATRSKLADMGYAARLFWRLTLLFGASFKRWSLIKDQVHFLGNYSLAIITVSGLCSACRATTPCSAMVRRNRWACWWR